MCYLETSLPVASSLLSTMFLLSMTSAMTDLDMSACQAYCAAAHPSEQTSCMENRCRSMYRHRVSRFGKRIEFESSDIPLLENILSACQAFCQAKYPGEQLTCMENRCRNMYRERVSRFGKRSEASVQTRSPAAALDDVAMSACKAYCQVRFPDDETLCVEYRCRSMYRERVGRFGKRHELPTASVRSSGDDVSDGGCKDGYSCSLGVGLGKYIE